MKRPPGTRVGERSRGAADADQIRNGGCGARWPAVEFGQLISRGISVADKFREFRENRPGFYSGCLDTPEMGAARTRQLPPRNRQVPYLPGTWGLRPLAPRSVHEPGSARTMNGPEPELLKLNTTKPSTGEQPWQR